ncbi:MULTISPECIES: xanthine dehydrogenase family protein molybdopterin-binding subunit [Metallosphaera]|uniref:Aldehyde oxidase and xanthine dehydrogenase, molybdopterin binding protein n=3 Tax=Metallosphaera TaxID=41980 RepID=A4YG78_METS5|nr:MULTISPECIES: xanthine dehydrogenase family protein molybdopterin-binding subunit [Metallosphaera]ABP95430.1 aldehyde oxidase and xanthine dehydrogenase, molybdopterin binding protein [Metallosphaera sedula DSM 5348]AIM27415.1 aldehyde oxidase and xanthine dehydrogenase, molybdopterin binding protein [Metallosphaera sedula]AKV74290.1 aldehyde oxidase [Metallosphaera sedula]AKV76529.1 aldehyde oxidase [Metallosphaera sedula]AKV78781.1 aldehyde oxidase [Metallosphaera sedula]
MIKIREHLDEITGHGKYIDDVDLPNTVYLGVVRSQVARGKVLDISRSDNVLLFLDWDSVSTYMPVRPDPRTKNVVKMPIVSDGRVNFVGQPVVAFVVKDRYEVEDVTDEIGVDYAQETPILSVKDSMREEIKIHEKGNIAIDLDLSGGDLEQLVNSEVTVERELLQDRIVQHPMEPKGVISYYNGETLTVIGSFQSAFRVRADLQEALGVSPEKIVVQSPPNVGGGFGNKVPAYPEYVLTALASMKLRRPVKWIETRREHLTNPTQGRGVWSKVKLHAKRDGTILGLEGTIAVDLGAYAFTINTTTPAFIASLTNGPYKMRFAKLRALGVYTNKPPTGPYRGAGRPEAALITETLVEDLAETLGLSPLEVRKKNLLDGEFTTPLGVKIDKAAYREMFTRAEQVYHTLKERHKGKAISFIAFTEVVRASPGEGAKVRVGRGEVFIAVGSGPHGQAHRTTFALLAGEVLGIDPNEIKVEVNNTSLIKEGIGSFGSRSAAAGGSAVIEASRAVLQKIRERGLTVRQAINSDEVFEAETFTKTSDLYTPGIHMAVLDLDKETGFARVLEYYAIDDVGRAIIPSEVEGQIVGGVLQGASQVLLEYAPYDENGNPVYGSIADNGFPTAVEAVRRVISESFSTPSNTLSQARGVGEAGTTGALPAVFIALEKALHRKLSGTPYLPG